MSNNEFNQAISVDAAPHESRCEWCGQPAVQQLTAIGGRYHNEGGFFCLVCGEMFIYAVNNPDSEMSLSGPPMPAVEKDEGYGIAVPLD